MAGIADFTSKLEAANTAYSEQFDAIDGVFPGTYDLLAEDLGGVDGTSLDIGFTDDLGEVRVMQPGEQRKFDGLKAYGATYDLEEIYTAHRIERKRVEYDPSGRIARGLARAAQRALQIVDDHVWAAIKANAKTGPDGVALFSSSHPDAGGQDNTTSDALGHSSYRAGKAAMRNFTRENGQPFDMNPTHLFVPPGSEDVAREVAEASDRLVAINASGAEATSSVLAATSIANVYSGDTIVVVTPRMAANTWFLADLSKPGIRPWVYGFGKTPEMLLPDPHDESIKKLAMLEYILSGDIAQGPGHWQAIYGKIS